MNLSPLPIQKFFDNAGRPLNGGLLFTYIAGTTTKLATYQDQGGTPNTNPIVLNFRGEANVWLDPALTYKFVLSPEGDTDPPSRPIWSVDNISSGLTVASLTAEIIGQILWPRSAAEITAGVNPVNFRYIWGSFQRYGMDPLGVASSSAALLNAAKSNDYIFDEYPGGGTYLFNSQVNLTTFPLRIGGATKGDVGSVTGAGTIFKLGAAAAVGSAIVRYAAFASCVEFERIKFLTQNLGQAGIGIRFAEVRSVYVRLCSFFGPGTVADDSTGVQFDGTGTFTGDVDVDKCYFSNHQFGINLQGSITDLRVTSCTLYGTNLHASSIGVLIAGAGCSGLLLQGNSFNLWNRSVFSLGNNLMQVGNRFENPATPQWEWVIGSATLHKSVGDVTIGPNPIYSQTDASANLVLSGAGIFSGGQDVQTTRAYFEGNGVALRAFAMGYPQVSGAGTFTGNGAMTWTGITQTVLNYALIGKTLLVWFNITGTVGGAPNTTLQIAIPGGFTAAGSESDGTCNVLNGGAWSVSTCLVSSGGTVIKIFTTPAATGNWTAGTVSVNGLISIFVA